MAPYESIQKYLDRFWDANLKATVFCKIDYAKQKQQLCAGLPKDMASYVNSQRPMTIMGVIHHAVIASKLSFQ